MFGSVALAAFLVERQVEKATLTDARSDLQLTRQAIEQLAEERRGQRRTQARLMAHSTSLREAVARGDPGRLQRTVEELAPVLEDVSLFAVLDGDGRPLAATGPILTRHPLPSLPPARVRPLAEALEESGTSPTEPAESGSETANGVWILGEDLLEAVAAPIVGDGGEGMGAVILAERLSDGLARRLQEISPSHVVILADRKIVATSLAPDEARRVKALFPLTSAKGRPDSSPANTPELGGAAVRASDPSTIGTREVAIEGTSYLAQLSRVPVDYGGRYCNHILLRSLEPAETLASTIRRNLLGVALLAVALAFAVAWIGARRIAQPLRRLAESMSSISRSGHIEPLEAVDGGGRELHLLENAFRRMLASLGAAEQARESSYIEAIGAVMAAVDRRDQESAGHSYRVAYYAVTLAHQLGVEDEELRAVEWGALLHDVGKIAVPDEILRKTGPLTEKEWQIMRQHPRWGYEMLADVKFLEPALDIVYNHHERWDGTGYPRGLKGEAIPLAARIFSVVDTYDAITSDRHYRRARSHDEAVWELRRVAGTQLDPRVVEGFLQLSQLELRKLHALSEKTASGIRVPTPIQEILGDIRTGTAG